MTILVLSFNNLSLVHINLFSSLCVFFFFKWLFPSLLNIDDFVQCNMN